MKEKQQETIHIGKIIKQKLNEKERSASWLAKKVDRSCSSFSRLLNQNHLHAELLFRISEVLEEDLFSYYSQALKQKHNLQ